MILVSLLFIATSVGCEEPTILNATSRFYGGSEVSCSIQITPFKSLPGVRSIKNGNLLLDGRHVWRWTVEDMPPENVVSSITMNVGGRKLAFPLKLLDGLVDLYNVKTNALHYVSASLYIDRNGEHWALALWFSDGGASFSATFSGTTKSHTITREIYKDRKLVDKQTGVGTLLK